MNQFTNPVPQFLDNDGSLLSAGSVGFYENGSTSTKKDTYNADGGVENLNPIPLSGEGRLPSCWGDGLYTVVLRKKPISPLTDLEDGEILWIRNGYEFGADIGQFSDYSANIKYAINEIVKFTDGLYYISEANNNIGNNPNSSDANWSQIAFLKYWTDDKPNGYSTNDVVIKDGLLYRSYVDSNVSTPPSGNWQDLTFNQIYQNYTPVIKGSTVPGVGTYTTQNGSYLKTGRLVTGTVNLFWSAHTGTGNIDISLPITASVTTGAPAGGGHVINSQSLTWAAGKQLTIFIGSGFSVARLIGIESNSASAQIPIDTNAGITIQFSYFVD